MLEISDLVFEELVEDIIKDFRDIYFFQLQ